MRRLAVALLGVAGGINCAAQFLSFPGPVNSHGGGSSYTGPGDVVSGALVWGGLRAYSAGKAGTKAANICNAGDANCLDINTLVNGDLDLTMVQSSPLNCTDDACTIKILYDQSGGTNCSGSTPCDMVSNTIANRPTLKFSCVGGKPCAHYAGSAYLWTPSNTLANVNQPFSASAVAERTATSGDSALIVNYNSQLGWSGSIGTGSIYEKTYGTGGGAFFNAPETDNAFVAVNAVYNGGSSSLMVTGTVTNGNSGTGLLDTSYYAMGGTPYGGGMMGYIAEGGIWPFGFTTGNQTAMTTNQRTYYGF